MVSPVGNEAGPIDSEITVDGHLMTPKSLARHVPGTCAVLPMTLAVLALAGCGGGGDAGPAATSNAAGPNATTTAVAARPATQAKQAAPLDAAIDSRADTAYNAWIDAFLVHDNGKIYFGQTRNNPKEAEGWIGATDTMIASDVYERSHARGQQQFVSTLVNSFLDVNKTDWWANYDWNDDIAWIAMAQLRAYQTTAEARFLEGSTRAWNITYDKGWNTASGGGGVWERMGHTEKCGLSNSPLVTVGAALNQITGDAAYLTKSEGIYAWVRANLFDPSSGQVFGCVDYPNFGATGAVQGGTSSNNVYDSGSFVEAATSLYRVTGKVQYRDDAQLAIKHVIDQNPILRHNSSPQNQWSYYFLRGLNQFCTLTQTCAQYSPWMKNNAEAAWNNRDANNLTWDDWTRTTNFADPDALMMSSAVAVWQLLPRNSDAAAFPGSVQIQNVASGLELGVTGDSTADGAAVVQKPAGDGDASLWTLVPTDNGYYRIKNVKTGLSVNVAGASGAPSAQLVQSPDQANPSGSDQWLPVRQDDGTYVFFNLGSHLALDNPAGSAQAGTQLSQWPASGTTAQRFQIVGRGSATDSASALPDGAKACFYADAHFQGLSFCASESSSAVGADWNDRISSFRVAPGYNMQLFNDVNYGGSVVALESDTEDLADIGFDNMTSAFKIQQNGVSSAAQSVAR